LYLMSVFCDHISSAAEVGRRYPGDMEEFAREAVRKGGEVDFAVPAELIGHPARAAMLLALLDGRALPMSMLADEAGVGASTASAHLTRLVEGGLLQVRQEGRHRYYALASQKVAEALEALAQLAPVRPVRSLRAGTRAQALRVARTCYDHVAGHLGVAVMRSLLHHDALTGGDGLHHPEDAEHDHLAAPGRDLDYQLTDAGWQLFDELGVRVQEGRRRTVAYCVDWTEQRHHLAGAAGAALLARFEELGWLVRKHKRALAITEDGRAGFSRYFGIDTEDFAARSAA
jgi:DNA-binding transcriptional ArsR family regulator